MYMSIFFVTFAALQSLETILKCEEQVTTAGESSAVADGAVVTTCNGDGEDADARLDRHHCKHCHWPCPCPQVASESTQTTAMCSVPASAKNTAASCSIPASATASMATALPLRDESTCIRAGGVAIVAADELGQPAAGSKLRPSHSETGAAAGKAILPSDRHVSRPIHAESLSGPESDDSDRDPTYVPPGSTRKDNDIGAETSDDDADKREAADIPVTPVTDRKYIVHEQQLDELFTRCRKCGQSVLEIKKKEHGSLVSVQTTCTNHHTMVWYSQPHHGRGFTLSGCGTWLIAAALLLSGGSFQTFALFASLLNLAFIGERSFDKTQKILLCPVINKAWQDHLTAVKGYFRGQTIQICGDGRCDSPGYSAKYGKLGV